MRFTEVSAREHQSLQKKLKVLILVCSGLLFASLSFSQNVKISGTTGGQAGELVRIIVYDDLFSKLEKTLVSTQTNKQGEFNVETNISQTVFAYLAVGIKRGEFYLSPNSEYRFTVFPDTTSRQGSIFDELPLQFICSADDSGLSDAIGNFNVQYNTFLYQYANKIYYGRDKSFIEEFKDQIDEQFNTIDDPYLSNYIRYSFASLEWTSKMKDNDSIVTEYFIGNPVLYNNIEYAEFFGDFFKTFFLVEKVFDYHEIIGAINEGSDVQAIKKLISRHPDLNSGTQLTELIAVFLVAKKYYNPDIRRHKVLQFLRAFESGGEYPENRKIAGNFIQKLQVLESGTKAPGFTLADGGRVDHSLSDYSGKFVLLSFIKPSCRICLEHLGLLDEVVGKFQGSVQNLTIVVGDDYEETVKYALERNFQWPFLDVKNNILLLEAYNIRAYPSYIIINPDGTISMATAPMPDENLELFLQRQIKIYENKHQDK